MKGNKTLLTLAEKVGSSSVQEAISLVLSMIQSVEEKSENKNLYKDELLDYLYIARNNLNIFIEFNNAQTEIKKLLDDILCLTKENDKVVMKNINYSCLNFEQFKYVMSWARRISMSIKCKKKVLNNNNFGMNKINNDNNHKKNINYNNID
ncbi:hypothetical protein [Clostridium tetani]|uniref:hypothetical protein n=1 Tax=Clostridium tetani TaxID=1513 RepID=UPI00131B7257|nr:hypothetical protein [Clostridium tetani]